MTLTVIWRPSAELRLAEIWTEAADRQRITYAADTIDTLLRTNPTDVGESRSANTRLLTISPLSVYYDVHDDDRLVVVWAAWRTGQR